MNELLESLKGYLDTPHEYRIFQLEERVPVKRFKRNFTRMEFVRLHPGSKRLTTFLRIDYSERPPFTYHRVELRMTFKILGVTFSRKLAALSDPIMLRGADGYIQRGEAILNERKIRIANESYEQELQIETEKMQRVVRNVQQ
jgi:hypothetical protein